MVPVGVLSASASRNYGGKCLRVCLSRGVCGEGYFACWRKPEVVDQRKHVFNDLSDLSPLSPASKKTSRRGGTASAETDRYSSCTVVLK